MAHIDTSGTDAEVIFDDYSGPLVADKGEWGTPSPEPLKDGVPPGLRNFLAGIKSLDDLDTTIAGGDWFYEIGGYRVPMWIVEWVFDEVNGKVPKSEEIYGNTIVEFYHDNADDAQYSVMGQVIEQMMTKADTQLYEQIMADVAAPSISGDILDKAMKEFFGKRESVNKPWMSLLMRLLDLNVVRYYR